MGVVLCAAVVSCAGTHEALAQGATAPTATVDTAASEDALRQRTQDLEAALAKQKTAAELAERLKAEIAAIGQDRAKLNQPLIDIATQVRAVETRIEGTVASLATLDGRERAIKASLDDRRAETAEVLAALQRAGRHVPPALFVRPEDSLQSLRTAMLLGALIPEMRERAEKLVADLGELAAVRRTITSERDRLAADRDHLASDRTRLGALVEERQKRQLEAEATMASERQRALALSREVENLQDLIARLEKELESAAQAARAAAAAAAAADLQASRGKPSLDSLKDPGRLTPAVAFAATKGTLALPVNGRAIRRFGEGGGAGGPGQGISLATAPGAQVTTPCDGWVVYSGPFRSYGQLLILNAGGGYHVLLAGMERISVSIGQFVLTGEPVATMGSASRVASILATNASQPVLYIEFRKDSAPIDPAPWWAASEGKKVRG
jgi:septal ring factor EnvC (AmiA/AmiB activator)